MSLLGRIRSGHARWGRPSLALVALAWLNLILQPCAMAMGSDSDACAHASSAHAHMSASAATGHEHAALGHAHEASHSDPSALDAHAHSHCADCGGGLADCVHLDDVNKNERQQSDTPDPQLAWLSPPPIEFLSAAHPGRRVSTRALDAACLTGAWPPLNVLYCVYLD